MRRGLTIWGRALALWNRWNNDAPFGGNSEVTPPGFEPEWDELEFAQWLGRIPRPQSSAIVPNRIVLTNYSLGPGGAERQIANTVRGLARRGLTDITMVCQDLTSYPTADFFAPALREAGTNIVSLYEGPEPPVGGLEPLLSLPLDLRREALRLAAIFRRLRPGVVYAWQDLLGVQSAFAALAVGVPRILLTTRTLSPPHHGYTPSAYRHLRGAFRVLANQPNVTLVNNSAFGAADYDAWLGLGRPVFRVHYNGVDPDDYTRASESESAAYRQHLGLVRGRPVVGTVMRLSEEKGPLLWIRTAAQIARQRTDVLFLLVGDGPLRGEVERAAQELGMSGRLLMPGTEHRAALPLSVMDVFLMTSRIEGLPNVLLEAQWCGIPVVAPHVGGTAEIVASGETGWVVEHSNEASLAERVLAILSDHQWTARARKLAARRMRERFSIDLMVDRTLTLLGLAPPPSAPGSQS